MHSGELSVRVLSDLNPMAAALVLTMGGVVVLLHGAAVGASKNNQL